MRVDPQDNIWAVDRGSNNVIKFDASGRLLKSFGAGMENFRLSEPSDQALREFLAVCRREGIRTGVLYMPEGSALREIYPPEKESLGVLAIHLSRPAAA